MSFKFPKHHRLRSRKIIGQLFSSGDHVFQYPFKLVFAITETKYPTPPLKLAVTVPKRRFKSAVKRNLIRRRSKEAYRKIKPEIFEDLSDTSDHYSAMIIYVGQEIESYIVIESAMKKLMSKFLKEVKKK